MRGLVSYILTCVVIMLAWSFITPPTGLRPALGNWSEAPVVIDDAPILPQYVDRTHKSDRLMMPAAIGKRRAPAAVPAVLVGCEPSFSPLSASATIAGRCIA
jgi:hypothetical protein